MGKEKDNEIKKLAHIGAGDRKDGFILWMA